MTTKHGMYTICEKCGERFGLHRADDDACPIMEDATWSSWRRFTPQIDRICYNCEQTAGKHRFGDARCPLGNGWSDQYNFVTAPQAEDPSLTRMKAHTDAVTEAQRRKAIPLYSGCIAYFPLALSAVAELSRIGNEQHNPGTPLHWDRSKSGDELDALARHLKDAGKIDTDKQRHSTKIAWRALANLEKELEAASDL